MLIAHYHWQVGLVADGRLLAAAAAASSDTPWGLACSSRVSLFPPNTSRPTRRQEDLRVQAGSCHTQGRPPPSGSYCGPLAGRGGEPGRLSHFLPFLFLLPPAPAFLPASPSKPTGPGSLAGWFPRRREVGASSPAPWPQALSRGSQHRGGALRPLLASFSKVPADTKAVS